MKTYTTPDTDIKIQKCMLMTAYLLSHETYVSDIIELQSSFGRLNYRISYYNTHYITRKHIFQHFTFKKGRVNMIPTLSTPQDLGKAIRNGENKIIVTGSLGSAVIRIEAIGPTAWVLAIGSIGVAVTGVMTSAGTGGLATPVGTVLEGIATPALITTFGSLNTVKIAILIAVAGGGICTLTSLRKYKAKRENGKVVLIKG